MKPRSSTGTRASSMGRNLPFRKTMQTSLLEQQAECIPGAAEEARHGDLFQRYHGILAERLAFQLHPQHPYTLPARDRRDHRRMREQLRAEPARLAFGYRYHQALGEAGPDALGDALPDGD